MSAALAAVSLEAVTIDFPVYSAFSRSSRARLLKWGSGGRISAAGHGVVVRALDAVSARFEEGDRVALVGRNGAGKSTLLRAITGVYEPVRGRVAVEGKLVPLLDMQLGIDPEATGYENIVMRGMVLGLTRAEIEARIPEIEAFTELGEHLSLPLRTFSSGMNLRLGFAVSTCVEPDILLLDEVVGAGDARFLERARARLLRLMDRVRILVVASHSPQILRQLCNKALLLQGGRVAMTGPVEEVLARYEAEP